ncbi:hypothetical protein HK100_005796 [Physocladia obscura]|uniref:Apple domain-containing protein n=1 Tax=Physocladia obscura TaxID=109957 RepID=A0AAD5SR73_9FUNG|nr:hypothetical protein HK100_005796 [Physocladia obscura]
MFAAATFVVLVASITVSAQSAYTFPDGQDWGYNCDYPGGDITNLQTSGALCGPACQAFAGCEYFVWTDVNGGTCWLKDYSTTGVVSAATGVCGFLSPASPNYGFNDATTLEWAYDCGWDGTVLSSTVHPDGSLCGGECLALSACTHFHFNNTAGTCDFFDSTATGPIYNPLGSCGFTTPDPAVVVASSSDSTPTTTTTTTTTTTASESISSDEPSTTDEPGSTGEVETKTSKTSAATSALSSTTTSSAVTYGGVGATSTTTTSSPANLYSGTSSAALAAGVVAALALLL